MDKQIFSDYGKWLLYSFGNQGIDNYYNLYKALQTNNSYKSVKISKSDINEVSNYLISCDNVDDELEITEKIKNDFIKYLSDNYFQENDIDELMEENIRRFEISQNLKFSEPKRETLIKNKPPFTVKPHRKEINYFNIKLVISLLFYLVIAGIFIYGILTDFSNLLSMIVIVPIVISLVLIDRVIKGIFIGVIRGSSIHITKEQFPEIYKIIEEQAQILKVKLPEIYITTGNFNAFVTKFSRSHILMIYSEVIETTLKGDYDVLKYVTAHELCHIKQKHLTKAKYLFPSRIIPFLSLAYSRGCEYTCDRVGYNFSPKGSIEGILIMTTGKAIYSKCNIDLHLQNCIKNEGFWIWLSEKFLSHPHLYKRLIEIKNYSKFH